MDLLNLKWKQNRHLRRTAQRGGLSRKVLSCTNSALVFRTLRSGNKSAEAQRVQSAPSSGRGGAPPPPSKSVTSAGCPVTQLGSDTTTQRHHQTPQGVGDGRGWGPVLPVGPLLQTSVSSPARRSSVLLTSWLYSRGFQHPSLDLTEVLEWLTELRKPFSSRENRFITKDMKGYTSTTR